MYAPIFKHLLGKGFSKVNIFGIYVLTPQELSKIFVSLHCLVLESRHNK